MDPLVYISFPAGTLIDVTLVIKLEAMRVVRNSAPLFETQDLCETITCSPSKMKSSHFEKCKIFYNENGSKD